MKRNGEYYALPTAVRSLALFYNKKLFQEAGLDPNSPPKTVEELIEAAKKTTKRDAAGNLLVEGITLDFPGQDYHWWREALLRQNGGAPYSDDNKTIAYNSEAGVKSLNWYADLQRTRKVGQVGFMDEGQAAFRAGRAAMTLIPPRGLRRDQGLRVGRRRTAGLGRGQESKLRQLLGQRHYHQADRREARGR
jgi:multiple sugar transport system substrate-binding protein